MDSVLRFDYYFSDNNKMWKNIYMYCCIYISSQVVLFNPFLALSLLHHHFIIVYHLTSKTIDKSQYLSRFCSKNTITMIKAMREEI